MNETMDPNGRRHVSFAAMCEFYHKDANIVHRRITLGWPLKKALLTPVNKQNKKPSTDHTGKEYPSYAKMCEAWGLPTYIVTNRLEQCHWSLEKALTTPARKLKMSYHYFDHLGNEYESYEDMCNAYGMKSATVTSRTGLGWTLEDALTVPININGRRRASTDHCGNHYPTVAEMCKAYQVSSQLYRQRINKGWTQEKALTTPVRPKRR